MYSFFVQNIYKKKFWGRIRRILSVWFSRPLRDTNRKSGGWAALMMCLIRLKMCLQFPSWLVTLVLFQTAFLCGEHFAFTLCNKIFNSILNYNSGWQKSSTFMSKWLVHPTTLRHVEQSFWKFSKQTPCGPVVNVSSCKMLFLFRKCWQLIKKTTFDSHDKTN